MEITGSNFTRLEAVIHYVMNVMGKELLEEKKCTEERVNKDG